jgi:hypothetical protein
MAETKDRENSFVIIINKWGSNNNIKRKNSLPLKFDYKQQKFCIGLNLFSPFRVNGNKSGRVGEFIGLASRSDTFHQIKTTNPK